MRRANAPPNAPPRTAERLAHRPDGDRPLPEIIQPGDADVGRIVRETVVHFVCADEEVELFCDAPDFAEFFGVEYFADPSWRSRRFDLVFMCEPNWSWYSGEYEVFMTGEEW